MRKIAGLILFLSFFLTIHAALLVDDAETGTNTNALGGVWTTYNDGYSSAIFTPNSSPAYAGNYCRKMDWTIIAGSSGPYAGAASGLNAAWSDADISAYYGLRFYAKGSGSYAVNIAEEETRTENNHYSAPIDLTSSWQLYELPFSQFTQTFGTHKAWDPAKLYAAGFTASGAAGANGNIYFDNMEFYLQSEASAQPDPNVIILQPKTNQLGYLPAEKKYFTVVTNTASTSDPYKIFDSSGNTAFSGTITGAPVDDRQSSGEGVFKVDFSPLTAPGTYHIVINGKESCSFKISDNVYDRLFKDALRCFYLIRCGTSINDPVTGLNRNACHLQDAQITGGGQARDCTGGWHNAGDFGKWIPEEALTCADMMWLYELKKSKMRNLKNNIRESKNAVSDLLDEAKWGLDWMLKLQNPDGSVYQKVDTQPNFCWGIKPDLDPFTRFVSYQSVTLTQTPSSTAAGDFVAAMAQAARVYKDILPGYAKICADAAVKSWLWLKNNRGIGQTDPYYLDAVSWQEEEWAMAEIFRLTGDSTVSALFDTDTNSHALESTSWMTPEFFGYFSLYQDSNTPQAIKDKIKARITSLCDTLVSLANAAGYGVARAWTEYYWESNEDVMNKANNLLMAYTITGNNAYKDTALGQLGYILGNNSLNTSFVTKEGTNYNQHPYHWVYSDYNIVIPGWASGGPNEWAAGAGNDLPLIALINKGTPPAKCWLDLCSSSGSYASNEGETSENAALVFLSGFFLSEEDADAGIDTSSVPVKHPDDIIAYPSLCDLREGDTGITFFNLPVNSTLRVYNLTGGQVFRAEINAVDGVYFWNLLEEKKNGTIAPGVYVYSVTKKGGFAKTGKIAVVR